MAAGLVLCFWINPVPAQTDFQKGLQYHQSAHFDSAFTYLHRALFNFRQSHSSARELACLNALALHHLEYSAFDSCWSYLERAGSVFKKKPELPDSLGLQTSFLKGRYHLILDQFDQARPLLEKAHQKSPNTGQAFRAETLLYLGLLYIRQAEFDRAHELLTQALALHPEAGAGQGEVLAVTGIYFQEKRNWKKALEHYRRAAEQFETHLGRAHPKVAMIYVRIGLCQQVLGKQDSAAEWYQKGLRIQQKQLPADHLDRVLGYGYMGILKGLQGDHGQALDYFQQALRIVSKHMGERHRLVASNHNNIGNALIRLERYEEAAYHIQLAAELFAGIFGPDHIRVGSAYSSLGLSYKYLGQFDKSLASYQQALTIRTKRFGQNHASLAPIYNNIGACYESLEDFRTAIDYYQQAVQIGIKNRAQYDGILARYHNNVGKCYRLLRDYPQSLQWHQKALGHLAAGFASSDPEDNPGLKAIVDKRVMVEVLSQKAQCLAEYSVAMPDYLPSALSTFQLAVDLIDSMRLHFLHEDSRYQIAANSLEVYEGAISCAYRLYRQNSNPQWMEYAFQMSEKNKAVLLLQSLKDVQARQFGQIPDSLLVQEQNLSREITELEEKIFKARFNASKTDNEQIESWENKRFVLNQRLDSLSQTFEQQFPDYYRLKYEMTVHKPAQVRALLPHPGTALVEYFVGTRTMAIFYLSDQRSDWTLMPLDTSLFEEVSRFRQLLAQPLIVSEAQNPAYNSSLATTALQLYHTLVEPLYSLGSDTAEALIIVPDGVLGYLPFDALLTEYPEHPGRYKSYPYLLHRHPISYAYSATILQEMLRPPTRSTKGLLAMAPVFETINDTRTKADPLRNGFSPLTYNRQEAQAVHQLIGGTLLLAEEASEQNFRLQADEYQIIHLSSHARVNDLDPLYSQIAFTTPRDSLFDGVITLAELFDLSLPADMIVLSACETGVGKLYRGEGIASLARGFAYAGARSIITTLWSVNDAATAEIMPSFYEHLRDGISKDQALRLTKQQYLNQADNLSAHPFYWAGFVPIGNMEPLEFPSFNFLVMGGIFFAVILVVGGIFFARKKA